MSNLLNELFEDSLKEFWSKKCFSDYQSDEYTFEEVGNTIVRHHLTWKAAGFEPGFRVAICGRNCSQWAISLISAFTYGAVAVPLLNEFTSEQISRLVNHSETKILFVSQNIWNKLDVTQMPGLEVVMLDTKEHEVVYCKSEAMRKVFCSTEDLFKATYPDGLKPEDIKFHDHVTQEQLVMINYTSGTTSEPKGVMLPARALWSNMRFAQDVLPDLDSSMSIVSLLPLAHVYGMSFELLYEFVIGVDVTFITRALSPNIILQAFKEVRPDLIILVPLIMEKVVRKGVLPKWNKPIIKLLRKLPGVGNLIKKKFRDGLYNVLGGKAYEIIIGGAALNAEVEEFLADVKFPYTVGYGMTECAPIIGYSDYKYFQPHSCGRIVPRMEIRIDSEDSRYVPGEIQVKGMNVMLGYYKNEEATAAAIDSDGWLHTGDMGVLGEDGSIYIRGRVKNMLLSGTGQNIYPEEIEAEIMSLKYVIENVVVQRDTKLVALVYPDREAAAAEGLADDSQIEAYYKSCRETLNKKLASYAHISSFELMQKEFAKTPKKSIKRFMYH